MATLDLPLLSMLKTRMQWHQTRQKLLAENVANADSPGFRPRDLREPLPQALAQGGVSRAVGLAATHPGHMAGTGGGVSRGNAARFEVTPSGNGVVLEDEMMKVSQNQNDFQMAATLYGKSLQLLKTAIGRRS